MGLPDFGVDGEELLEGGILGVRPNLHALSGECGRFDEGEHRVLQSIMNLPRRKHCLSTRVVAREGAKPRRIFNHNRKGGGL
jgi:hypothetical protein